MRHQTSYLLVVISITIFLSLPGCSITGWTTKDIPDGSDIGKGNAVTITTKAGKIMTGQYIGVQDIPIPDYAISYNETISQSILNKLLPQYGENIQITTKIAENKVWEGQFISFDLEHIRIMLKGKSEPAELYISGLTTLSKIGEKRVQMMQFRRLFENGDIPLRSAVVLKNGNDDLKIPINEIQNITSGSIDVARILSSLRR
ncbi:MAG: hypothetical protein HZB59_12730 [Ignavibacteriales bacterium]|nr:hypothetical protein [Ignavibacteriales bacterium]